MSKILIYCPINCETYCLREITDKLQNVSEEKYSLKIIDRGILLLEIIIQTSDELRYYTGILSNCFTIEKLRVELKSEEIPTKIRASGAKKVVRVNFLEKSITSALKVLLKLSSSHSLTLISNVQHWNDITQREIQGILKKTVNNLDFRDKLQFNLKEFEIELHMTLTPKLLKITVDLPVQTLFSQLKPHPTPVFPSVAHVMVQLGLEQVPRADRFVDAMCGAGNLALMVTQVVKEKLNLFVGGFDKDSNWIKIAIENSQLLKASHIEFLTFDLLSDNFEVTFPFPNIDLLLAHPPYSHFVPYTNEILEQIYHNLLVIFQKFSRPKACLVINSPRSEIIMPLIKKFPLVIIKTIEIPRKATTVKLWVLVNN